MPVGAEIAEPLWLVGLPLVAAVLIVARYPWWRAARRVGGAAVRQEIRRTALRLAWTSLILLALADVTLIRYLPRQAVVIVADASASLAAARDQVERAARGAAASLREGDLMGVVAVAAGAQIEELPVEAPVVDRLTARLRDDGSDLASGLRLAGALLPEGYRGRVVLVSDGQQTTGDALAAARSLAARDVSVDVLPIGSDGRDVLLTRVELPATARADEVSTLWLGIESAAPTPASIRVFRDDALLAERSVELRAGAQQMALPVPVGEPGLHRYRVDVAPGDAAADSTTINNSLGAIQRVLGQPRVLLVASRAESLGWLPLALAASGIDVAVASPEGAPVDLAGWARYDAVVLVDVPATALSAETMELLEVYVRDLGRGLVMTGGPDSFGPGGYAETPVERTLPVTMDVRGRGREPRVALTLVIDKSGSMAGEKIEMAKEAAARSIRLLRADDRAAILAFDSVPQWVAPLTPLTERDELELAVGEIYAAGGTDIYPAVAAGFESLREVEADVKHVILLTDGQSGASGDYPALLDRMRAARVTLSTVAVGGDADTTLLQALARLGRGRYHFAATPRAIPQIFSSETLMAARTVLVDQQFLPAAASTSPILRGLSVAPPLDGYVAVLPKDRAEVVLVAPEGDPILAAWQYGAGRALAWTPDLGNRWSAAWAASPAAALLWGNAFSWLLPAPDAGELAVRAERVDERSVSIIAENRTAWEEVRPTMATVIGPGGQARHLDLQAAGPGQYRAEMAMPEAGAYVIQVVQSLPRPLMGRESEGTTGEVRAEAGWVAPYPAEYRQVGVNHAFLARVAAAGGGQVLTQAAEAVRPPDESGAARWSAAGLLLVLAAIVWPLEIAARRLSVPQVDLARLGRVARARVPVGANGHDGLGAVGVAPGPPPTIATAQRLLRRKQTFRDERR